MLNLFFCNCNSLQKELHKINASQLQWELPHAISIYLQWKMFETILFQKRIKSELE